jgi:hypothetical protein
VKSAARSRLWSAPRSAFAGFRFPAEVIVVASRWYMYYRLPFRGIEELLPERSIEVDPMTVYRWVQQFTPLLAGARSVHDLPDSDRLQPPLEHADVAAADHLADDPTITTVICSLGSPEDEPHLGGTGSWH